MRPHCTFCGPHHFRKPSVLWADSHVSGNVNHCFTVGGPTIPSATSLYHLARSVSTGEGSWWLLSMD